MLKVECESCRAPYQVDERRVPPAGLKMRCPKCGHSFVVKDPNAPEAAPPPAPPAGGPRVVRARAPSLPAEGERLPKPRAPSLPAEGERLAKPRAPSLPGIDERDLPAVAETDLPARVRPNAPIVQKRSTAAPPPAPRESDLPALVTRGGKGPPPPPPRPGGAGVVGHDFEIDLPAPQAPKVARGAPPAEADLPVVVSAGVDLPRVKGPTAELPTAKRAPGLAGSQASIVDLPAPAPRRPPPRPPPPSDGGAFGEIDLPSVVNDLPVVATTLPSVVSGASNLPSPITDDRHLPTRKDAGPARASMPSSHDFGMPDDFGELELPRAPVVSRAPAAPPSGLVTAGPSPAPPSPFGHGASPFDGDPGAFGELELPALPTEPGEGGDADAPVDEQGHMGAGFSSLPPLPPLSSQPARDPARGAGGLGYGELDLGGASEVPDSLSASPFGTEASLAGTLPASAPPAVTDAAQLAAVARMGVASRAATDTTTVRRERPATRARARRKGPILAAAAFALVLLGGGALHLTPYGAFGYELVQDRIHAAEYAALAADAATRARAQMASDLFPDARAACDALAAAHDARPRARALEAYAALAELEQELRFGRDVAREGRAKGWLHELAETKSDAPGLDVALATQAALDGELEPARQKLDAAAKAHPGDALQADIAFVLGETELDARDGVAALAAFTRALALAPTARAHFGLARAAFLAGDSKAARAAIDATLAASPNHGGAVLLRAEVTWAGAHDDDAAASALRDLATVLDGPAKATVSAESLAEANAARGGIQLIHGRAGDARASFDAAVKLDPRNVAALVGQGEVLYADGRYTEALSRFDTAVQTDPGSVAAVVGDAKTKIALERLADAKAQLTLARQRAPKAMLLARWLAAAESALGNKKEAEQQLLAAVDLADPKDAQAIDAYAALAAFLNAQGRAPEAKAKLDEARKKLPESAALQRALGDVSVAQGKYDDAITHYQAALARDPSDTSTKFKLGQTYRRMTKGAEASALFDEVAAVDKDFPGLSLERGLLDEQTGDMAGALELFQNALAKAPGDPDLQLRVGAAYVAVGKPEDARPLLKKVLEQRSNSAEAHHYVGRAYLLEGPLHQVEAMRDLKRAAELDPNRAEYHLYIAWAANQASPPDFALAGREIDKALALDALNADAYWQRGVMEHALGAIEDALRDLRKSLELKPTRHEAYATMAECFEEKNDTGAAMAAWQRALSGADTNPYWHYKYGRLLFDRGSAAEAAKNLRVAAVEGEKLQPRPGWIAPAEFKLAEALRKAGKKQEAIEHYNAFLSMPNTINSPDRVDAIHTLRAMGAPWQPSQ